MTGVIYFPFNNGRALHLQQFWPFLKILFLFPLIPEILTIWVVKVNFVLTGIDH